MEFKGDVATIQRRIADSPDLVRRRLEVLAALDPRPGERVLDVGCGGGALLLAIGGAVGASGRAVGIDVSADQIEVARLRCADRPQIEAIVADVRRLPHPGGHFDAVVAVQVLEYLADAELVLRELRRVLSDRGRAVIAATNWDSVLWHGGDVELTREVERAWREHAPHPNFPAELRPLLGQAGFQVLRQAPVAAVVDTTYQEDSFAFGLARLMVSFGVSRQRVSERDARAWLASLAAAREAERFFLSVTPVVTVAVAVP
jgi:SAM-dependent methyltransferase